MAQAKKSRPGWGKKFLAGLKKVRDWLTVDGDFGEASRMLLSLVFFAAAGSIVFFEFEKCYFWWGWCKDVKFTPGFISGLLALGLVFPMYARGILVWEFKVYGLFSLGLIVFVSAVAIKIALLGPDFFGSLTSYLLIGALMLSWLGMREIAGYAWLSVIVLGAYNAVSNDVTLGFYGFAFVLCAFLGIMLHNPDSFQNTLKALSAEYSKRRG